MQPPKFTFQALLLLALLALLFSLTGCQLPFGPRPTTSPAATGPAGSDVPVGGIPSNVLTEVAATLYAPLAATWTAQAETGAQAAPTQARPTAQPTAALPTAIAQAPTRQPTATPLSATAAPTQAPPTVAPTQAPAATVVGPQPTAAQPGSAPTALPQPTNYLPVNPPANYAAQSGATVQIAGVNLPACGGLTANFMVINTSDFTLESVSLQIEDLSTGVNIYGPVVSEAPFMLDDRVCAPGGWTHLPPGYALFTGAATNVRGLSTHTLQANFLLCSGNNLSGTCYTRTAEFVVP